MRPLVSERHSTSLGWRRLVQGAKLAMFGLGFYSRRTSQRGLLCRVAVGFAALAYAGFFTDLAWPWYCALGELVSIAVEAAAGRTARRLAPYSVVGQQRLCQAESRPTMHDGWHLVPVRIDKANCPLLAFFLVCVLAPWLVERAI